MFTMREEVASVLDVVLRSRADPASKCTSAWLGFREMTWGDVIDVMFITLASDADCGNATW